MIDLSPKERYLKILEGKKVDRVSCSCPLQTGTADLMKLTGSYWPDAHKNAVKMADLSYGAWEHMGLESVRVPFCLTIEAEALGCGIDIDSPKSQPAVKKHVLTDPSGLEDLKVPNPEKDCRMPVVGEAISILKEKVGDELPIIGGILSPFTLAGHLRGVENLLIDTFDNPGFVEDVVSFASEVAIEYSRFLLEMGADSICLIDPSATTELIGPDMFASLAGPMNKKVIDKINAPTVLHICGDTTAILDSMEKTGANGVSVDPLVDRKVAKSKIKDSILVGNINPVETLLFGDVEKVKAEARQCIDDGVGILAPGCGLSPNTPLENVKAYTELVRGN